MSQNLTGSTTALFVVKLSAPVAEPVTVHWQTEDGSAHAGIDYQAAAGTIVFAPGETEKGIEVVVLGREDGSTGDGLTFYVRVKPPVNAVLLDELNECRITVETDDGVVTTSLVVATGPRGKMGNPGLSAYELAKSQGYQGSLTDWLGAAGVQAVVMASQAAAQAGEQLDRAFRFAPGNKVPELPPIEQMEGKVVVVRNGQPQGLDASNNDALGLATNLGKDTGSGMVGHVDKLDGKAKTVAATLDNTAEHLNASLQQAGTFEAGVQALTRSTQLVWDATSDTYFYWTGAFPKGVPAGSTPTSAGGTGKGAWMAAGAETLRAALAHATGLSQIGGFESFADLRNTQPAYDGQIVQLISWNEGQYQGGDRFVGRLTKLADDGGMVASAGGNWHWKRLKDWHDMDVLDFGARMDGTSDDMPAVKAMYAATRVVAVANPVGVRLPAGEIGLSGTLDVSTATEQPMFRLKGPDVEFGVVPVVKIRPLDATSTVPLFQLNARRLEVTGIHIDTGDNKANTKPFLKNLCGRGEYVRVKCVRVNNSAGLTFDLLDTIDTKFEQIYCYGISAGFLLTGWTNGNPGAWDHPTAIEISNANFSGTKNVEPLRMVRAGQSLMRNVWFSNNDYSFDISQGGWTLDTVIQEGNIYPAKTKYAKMIRINCRFAQGAGLDNEGTTFDPAMDQGKPIPSWVTNAMDQGDISISELGSSFSGLSSTFNFSETVLANTTGAAKWVEIGRVTLQEKGRTCRMKLLGTSGWDNAAGNLPVPGGTTFGGGSAEIFIEAKNPAAADTSAIEVHWFGTGACPISDVKYVRSWSNYTIYVKMASYCLYAALFIDSNGKPREATGAPFYTRLTNADVADINAVAGIKQASCRWNISRGDYNGNGLGMDLDSGEVLLYTKARVSKGAATFIPVMLNGEQVYVQASDKFANRIPYYNFDDLPSAADYVYCEVLCPNTAKSPSMQKLYSNGYRWIYAAYPTETVTKIADGSPIINY